MAMTTGSVTVNATTGTYSGTGAALAIMDGIDAQQTYPDPASPPAGVDATTWQGIALSVKIATRKFIAGLANGIAALVPYISANADLNFTQYSLSPTVPNAAGTTTVPHPNTIT